MARTGITYQDVANAAATVQGHQQTPTVDRIRGVLGTGSKSTIARYLKEWKSQSENLASCNGVPEELGAIVKGLWERLQQEAEEKIIRFQQEADKEIAEAKLALTNEQKEHLILQNQKRLTDEELHHLSHQHAALQTSLEESKHAATVLTERNNALNQQHEAQKTETARLHQLLSHVQANLEHYQHSMQKLREEQLLAAENQRLSYEKETEVLKQKLTHAVNHSHEFQRTCDQLTTELKLMTQQYQINLEEKNVLQKTLHEKLTHETILQKQCEQLTLACSEYKKTLEKNTENLFETEKRAAVLTEQVHHLNKSLTQAQDSVRILRDEKLFLAQEKAMLEGQFKKLQA